jgi:hypothetical protein
MCCFSQPVELVGDTNIFARSDNVRQFLVYSMSYAAPTDLAMVLPLPVPPPHVGSLEPGANCSAAAATNHAARIPWPSLFPGGIPSFSTSRPCICMIEKFIPTRCLTTGDFLSTGYS